MAPADVKPLFEMLSFKAQATAALIRTSLTVVITDAMEFVSFRGFAVCCLFR